MREIQEGRGGGGTSQVSVVLVTVHWGWASEGYLIFHHTGMSSILVSASHLEMLVYFKLYELTCSSFLSTSLRTLALCWKDLSRSESMLEKSISIVCKI